MSAGQHAPGPKVHLQPTTRTGRSVCRYSSRPSRKIKSLHIQEFADTPVEQRCAECQAKYQRLCAAIAKTKDTQP